MMKCGVALARRRRTDYDYQVPDKEGNGFEIPTTQKRITAPCGFFTCVCLRVPFYERRWWGSLRARWLSFVCRYLNLVICRSPRLRSGRGLPHTKEFPCTITPAARPPIPALSLPNATKRNRTQPNAILHQLTKAEVHLVELYRKMDDDTRSCTISVCSAWVGDSPRKIVPALHLVVGGAA